MRRFPLRRTLRTAVLLALVALLAACTSAGNPSVSPSPASSGSAPAASGEPTVYPVIVSSEQVVGPNRLLFSFLDPGGTRPVATEDRAASIRLWPDARGESAAVGADGRFIWAIPDVTGVYVAYVDLAEAGPWTAEFTTSLPGGPDEVIRFGFDVQETGFAKRIGDQAPAVRTPTLADVGGDVRQLSTDPVPVERFYETSVDDALASGRPFVLVFATPLFCTSATCGPLLEQTKVTAAAHPDLTVINVEPYRMEWQDERLQPILGDQGQLQPIEAVETYGILSEPWICVVGADGTITAVFEGAVAADELEAAFAAVDGP
jgi:hypothetical protein